MFIFEPIEELFEGGLRVDLTSYRQNLIMDRIQKGSLDGWMGHSPAVPLEKNKQIEYLIINVTY